MVKRCTLNLRKGRILVKTRTEVAGGGNDVQPSSLYLVREALDAGLRVASQAGGFVIPCDWVEKMYLQVFVDGQWNSKSLAKLLFGYRKVQGRRLVEKVVSGIGFVRKHCIAWYKSLIHLKASSSIPGTPLKPCNKQTQMSGVQSLSPESEKSGKIVKVVVSLLKSLKLLPSEASSSKEDKAVNPPASTLPDQKKRGETKASVSKSPTGARPTRTNRQKGSAQSESLVEADVSLLKRIEATVVKEGRVRPVHPNQPPPPISSKEVANKELDNVQDYLVQRVQEMEGQRLRNLTPDQVARCRYSLAAAAARMSQDGQDLSSIAVRVAENVEFAEIFMDLLLRLRRVGKHHLRPLPFLDVVVAP